MKNSGGGSIANTVSDAVFNVIHAAKITKLNELNIKINDPRSLKLVAYYTDFVHSSTNKGLYFKDIHYQRKIPSYFDE